MVDTKARLSLFWIVALLNYVYADVLSCSLTLARRIQAHISRNGLCWVQRS